MLTLKTARDVNFRLFEMVSLKPTKTRVFSYFRA